MLISINNYYCRLISLLLMGLTLLALVGCYKDSLFDSGDDDYTPPHVPPTAELSGVAFDAAIREGTVRLSEGVWDGYGRRPIYRYYFPPDGGSLLIETQTDSKGRYLLTVPELPSGVYRLEVRGGRYREEYSGREVFLDDDRNHALVGYIDYTEGEPIDLALTYYTTLAAAYTEHLVAIGMDEAEAVEQGYQTISDWLGLDIQTVTPVDITDDVNMQAVLTPAKQYGFFTSAISSLTAWAASSHEAHQYEVSIDFITNAYDDLRYDGQLNGQQKNGTWSIDQLKVEADIYRAEMARHVLVMANHNTNAVGMTAEHLLPAVKAFNDYEGPILGDAPVKPLDTEAPIITSLSWTDGQIVSGLVELSAEVVDIVGLQSVTLSIPTMGTLWADNPAEPHFWVDTTELTDGIHTVTITAVNWAGGTTAVTQAIAVSNEALTISNMRPAQGEIIRGFYRFSAEVNDPVGIESVRLITNIRQYPNEGKLYYPWVDINTKDTYRFAQDGTYTFTVEATSWTGYEVVSETQFIVDNTKPNVTIDGVNDGEEISGLIELTVHADDLNGIASIEVYLGGTLIADSQDQSNLNVILNTSLYPNKTYSLSAVATDMAGNQGLLNYSITIAN